MSASDQTAIDPTSVQRALTDLGRRIASARAYRKLSQAAVAGAAETIPARISAIENGGTVRVDTLVRVAQAVGLELTLREPAA